MTKKQKIARIIEDMEQSLAAMERHLDTAAEQMGQTGKRGHLEQKLQLANWRAEFFKTAEHLAREHAMS